MKIIPVVLSIFAVTTLQIAVHMFNKAGLLYSGIAFNELIVLTGVPLAVISIFRLDLYDLIRFQKTSFKILAFVVIITLSADVLIDYLMAASEHFFPPPEWVKRAMDQIISVSSAPEFFWKLFLLCALPAVCEEIFFRGFCQTSLAAVWGNKTAIFLTALLFATLHLNPWHFHLYFLLGLLLGFLYAETNTLWAPIFCHFINNLWTFICNLINFKLPLESPFGWQNLVLIAGAIFVLIASLAGFRYITAQFKFKGGRL